MYPNATWKALLSNRLEPCARLTSLHAGSSRATACRAEPVLLERIPLERGVADRAEESSTVREYRGFRGGGRSGVGVVAHLVRSGWLYLVWSVCFVSWFWLEGLLCWMRHAIGAVVLGSIDS